MLRVNARYRSLVVSCLCLLSLAGSSAWAQPPRGPRGRTGPTQTGLLVNRAGAYPGYTLYAPLNSTTTYLIDLAGTVVHAWSSSYTPGQAVYLLDDGSLLRGAREPRLRHFGGGGIGGRVERLAPDGKVLWEFVYANDEHCLHHDIEPLPNGNVLMIAWEKKTADEAIAAGYDPDQLFGDELWPDRIIEVAPRGPHEGEIVWEWHVWDHLVQDFDESKSNFGDVAAHPELVNLNYRRVAPRETPAEIRRLRALGYVGGPESDDEDEDQPGPRPPGPRGFGGGDPRADWCHTNSVAYNARLDQIALSVHTFNEIWIIDHSTTTREAASHAGGRYGHGGDLLYRWGNPRAYGAGTASDQQLFAQHDARWIPEGFPGAGHLLVFNNGGGRPGGQYSSVVEIVPPLEANGSYTLARGQAYGPSKPCWEYTHARKREFFSHSVSGAERLPNGNTLVCAGEQGWMLEVTPAGETVWEYVNPHSERRGPDEPAGPPGAAPTSQPRRRPPMPPPGGGLGRAGGPPPGGPPGMGGPASGSVFRASRFAADHPGIKLLLGAHYSQVSP